MKTKKKTETGLASVYIRHTLGFHGNLRPAYDSAADAQKDMNSDFANNDKTLTTWRATINNYYTKNKITIKYTKFISFIIIL